MDDKLLQLQAKKQRLDSYKPLQKELAKNLEEWFRIELIYTSNAIEGNTLTRQETAMVVSEQRFYTTEEVAKLLQVDPESVRRYVRRGHLRAVKLGGKFIRIDKVDLDTFIKSLKK